MTKETFVTMLSKEGPYDLESVVGRLFEDWPFSVDFMPRMATLNLPALDVYEKDGKHQLELAVPGYTSDEISIEVTGNMVTISGSHSTSAEKKEAKFHRREIRQGSFTRTVTLPQDVDSDNVDAKLDKGILTVSLSPMKRIAAKKIAIQGT